MSAAKIANIGYLKFEIAQGRHRSFDEGRASQGYFLSGQKPLLQAVFNKLLVSTVTTVF
jgi:hypothetical protein